MLGLGFVLLSRTIGGEVLVICDGCVGSCRGSCHGVAGAGRVEMCHV